jgi:hypothetical protein
MVSFGKTVGLAAMVAIVALLIAAPAQAATRFAAPGGTGTDPCANPATPCSIFTAADGGAPGTTVEAGDEVVLAPGEYSDAAGDLGPSEVVQLAAGISVHGEKGAERPVVRLEEASFGFGAFTVTDGDTLSHVEIDTSTARSNLAVFGGTVEGVIVRSTSEMAQTIACLHFAGTIRDTACLASGANSAAIGVSNATVATTAATLRNVTAVDTGAGGKGLSYAIFNSGTENVSAKAVIAKGDTVDVEARGAEFGGGSGHVAIELDHSDFATTQATAKPGGSASVTSPSANENVSTEPLLASDGYHELAGSPTINKGAVDGSSGTTDIDGHERSIGFPDIGADEMARSTETTLACVPPSLTLGATASTVCTVTVSDTSGEFVAPTAFVSFSSTAAGSFDAGAECAVLPQGEGISKCTMDYTPAVAGSAELTATYAGDATHEGSNGSFSLQVEAAPLTGGGAGGGGKGGGGKGGNGGGAAPDTSIKKKPPKRTRRRMAKFTFSSTQALARFECKLDRRRFRACASPFRSRVRPGRHSFQVRAVNAAGKADPTPAGYRWRVLHG